MKKMLKTKKMVWSKINGCAVDFDIRLNDGSDSCVEVYAAEYNQAQKWGMIDLVASKSVSTFPEAIEVIAAWKQQLQEGVGIYDLLAWFI
jgi:hypothetical protein